LIRGKTNTPIILNNFIIPNIGKLGILEANELNSQKNVIHRLNILLLEKVSTTFESTYFLDLNGISSSIGHNNFYDDRMYYISKVPYSGLGLFSIGKELSKIVKAIYGTKKKCIVLDCDNTLWGGIIGEDGLHNISLGEEYPGICYKNFQKTLLDYKRKGFVLTINSKNNYDDVIEVMEKHPHQILKKEDFAVLKIGWSPKNESIKEISQILNLSLDSFIFIDDSPIECKIVKDSFPEVKVLNLPNNPLEVENYLKDVDELEVLSLTDEDRDKTNQYIDNAKRQQLKIDSFDLKSFYSSLKMEINICIDHAPSVNRLAQLCQKTNQFNLTTIRHSESDIMNFIDSKNSSVYHFSLKDIFGDNGIVGLAIIKIERKIVEIDTFLMSYRVISRTAENNFLNYILADLARYRYGEIYASWKKTKKNSLVMDFFESFGFSLIEESENEKLYKYSLKGIKEKYDKWMKVKRV